MMSSTDPMRPEGELRAQHANWSEARRRLFNAPPPPAKAKRPRPVSPFVREAQERRRRQREAFERQMFRPEPVELPHVDHGWPPYCPAAPYDECAASPKRAPITMREIIREVAYKHRVTVNDIISERRHKPVVIARHEAMWRCKMETANSLPAIGRAFGGRDHTTAIAGIRRHELRMANGEV